jgi:hypothetical protein
MEGKGVVKLSDLDIVLYALYLLGGWQDRIHTEDIALKCFELARSRFSWVKYPQYPDLAPARFALEAAKKSRYGVLVEGESERKRATNTIGGWRLTERGVKWVNVNKSRIEQYLGKSIPAADRLPQDRKLKELINSIAFKRFQEDGEKAEISHAEFAESLVCTVNTKAEILNERLAQLYSAAEELKMLDIKNYVNFTQRKFASLLSGRGE